MLASSYEWLDKAALTINTILNEYSDCEITGAGFNSIYLVLHHKGVSKTIRVSNHKKFAVYHKKKNKTKYCFELITKEYDINQILNFTKRILKNLH